MSHPIGARGIAVLMLCVAASATAEAQTRRPPDLQRCARLQALLDNANAEYRSDEQRLQAQTPDQADSKRATLEYDLRRIQQLETQISAEGCPGAKPLVDAPNVIGGGTGSVGGTGPTTGTGGTGTGGTPAGGPAGIFVGYFDTRSELGRLHLERVPDPNFYGYHTEQADPTGPKIPCPATQWRSEFILRGYFRPTAQYPEPKTPDDWSRCDALCVIACVSPAGVLTGKFFDKTRIGITRKPMFVGVFTLYPPRGGPTDRTFTGDYRVMGGVKETNGTILDYTRFPATPWQAIRQ